MRLYPSNVLVENQRSSAFRRVTTISGAKLRFFVAAKSTQSVFGPLPSAYSKGSSTVQGLSSRRSRVCLKENGVSKLLCHPSGAFHRSRTRQRERERERCPSTCLITQDSIDPRGEECHTHCARKNLTSSTVLLKN